MRRLFMWTAVLSLGATALASALGALQVISNGGWTFYTPYTPPAPSALDRLFEAANYALTFLVPLAASSSAGYILLLDRDVRRGSHSAGFDVTPARPDAPISRNE